ncbi:biopolymer transporter ExbD [bacterium]|nr:biopolymer transporter ExbD [candidate division CSSED10-310 bacterium]
MRFRKKSKVDADIPNSSMSDIAFLLLIFFMVTTAFAARKGIDFRLPKESEDVEQLDQVDVKAIEIEVLASGRILINKIPKNIRDIQPTIRPQLAIDPKKFVIIVVHNEATYGDMMDVLDELKEANVQNIALPSKEEIRSWM